MPTTVNDLLRTYPADLGSVDRDAMARCIEECLRCAQACTACADACLSEPTVADLTKCIRTDMDCADVCGTTAAVLSRHTGYDANVTRAVLQACATVCRACGDECARHAGMHEHCRVCAEACRSCEQACDELLAGLG
ncbi:four-helix bundle copper-binding protein [Streptomyces violaceorubidus]